MKKFLTITISIVVIVAIVAGGYFLYKTTTPEYALAITIKDVNTTGMSGLKKHLTSSAIEKVEAIENWTDKSSVSGLLSAITQDSAVSFLKSKMSEVDWTVEDIRKGKGRTDVVIGFDYKGSIIGTIEITMMKENGDWKIDGLGLPHFDTISIW